MNKSVTKRIFKELSQAISGDIKWDLTHQMLYATDASVYRKYPVAVAFPKTSADIPILLRFCQRHQLGFIARTAGTSLAGQCVGEGLVVDFSKYMNQIIDFRPDKRQITVQPGIIRDELNAYLKPHGLFFGPNTSTSNRCMIGGMVGNNSSGTTSIKYGVTRDKVLRIQGFLADGSPIDFGPQESSSRGPAQAIETYLQQKLVNPELQKNIREAYPLASVHRRNNGYPLDLLIQQSFFDSKSSMPFNVAPFLSGTEGTLVVSTAITLCLDDLPPKHQRLVAAHFRTVAEALQAVERAMMHGLYTCELMDKIILDCTKNNREQTENRSFVEGDPGALLFLEVRADAPKDADARVKALLMDFNQNTEAYALPVLYESACQKAFDLRSAGLGLLGNIIGDDKAVACIEDTAVPLEQLAAYIGDFELLMQKYGQDVVYYAHAGAGELHLRPILNLKKQKDVNDFKAITIDVARLVKSYGGSMSGEHGDGIVRSETLPIVLGERIMAELKDIKHHFDPNNILNPGKIVDPYPMDQYLRYQPERKEPDIATFLDFSKEGGLLRAAEKCNGSGDCRKTTEVGVLCPSYRATKNEIDSTRGRANVLREVLTQHNKPFDSPELKTALDLCLSCKACQSECPSSVDVAAFKAEYLYQQKNKRKLRDYVFAYAGKLNALNANFPPIFNFFTQLNTPGKWIKNLLGIAQERHIPKIEASVFNKLKNKYLDKPDLYLYLDEFSAYQETHIALKAHKLLTALGFKVGVLTPSESGRTYISKGFLKQAQKCAHKNIERYGPIINDDCPLVGIEPSAVLTFTDEYLKLTSHSEKAIALAQNCMTIESFLFKAYQKGLVKTDQFSDQIKQIKVHTHCYQKALGKSSETVQLLGIPKNYTVSLIAAGCCGMAGSFGYEKEHYAVSQAIGNDRLFPAISKSSSDIRIAANGTSCRHQILEGVGRAAQHPIEILWEALQTTSK